LERVLAAFETAEVPVIVLKGSELARTIYPDPGLRVMNDIDIAVNPEHLGTSLKIGKQLGYVRWNMTYHALLVLEAEPTTFLELHWCFFGSGKDAIHPKTLFNSRSVANSVNEQAYILHLCAHLFYQHFGDNRRLIWGYDLYLLAQSTQINWPDLHAEAIRLGWENAVYACLLWLKECFQFQLPLELPASITDRFGTSKNKIRFDNLNHWIRQANRMLPFKVRLSWLIGIIFPDAKYLKKLHKPEPSWLLPLYYPYRWGVMLKVNLQSYCKRSASK
jgi:hypothetical protein